MLALLMAYKMKLMALVPILVGGVILLTSTTALAGFFFALFAAVLGLRSKWLFFQLKRKFETRY